MTARPALLATSVGPGSHRHALRAPDLWNLIRGACVLIALWSYRLARCLMAWWLLARWLGPAAATGLVGLLLVLRLFWPLRLGACIGLILLWHWPWWAAIPAAAPRLVLLLPGWLTLQLARVRHPRPRWPAT